MRLLLDITRTLTRAHHSTPSGIDRVEMAYFQYSIEALASYEVAHMFAWRYANGVLPRSRAAKIHEFTKQIEATPSSPSQDVVFMQVKEIIERPLERGRHQSQRIDAKVKTSKWENFGLLSPHDALRAGARLNRLLQKSKVPNVYLHVSHSQLNRPNLFQWLHKCDIPAVFFLHDLIPIEFPEFCRAGEYERHVKRLETIAHFASLVIANSEATARAAQVYFAASNYNVPEIIVAPLGVEDCFIKQEKVQKLNVNHPYAVVLGTIEPRKNLLFLFSVWRRLIEKHGDATPRIIVIGRRGWENENIIDIFERSNLLAPFVLEVSDLSDSGVASIIANANFLVAPSLAEGFGLPVVEGLSAGVPVIASDIAAHREVAQGAAVLVDPLDGLGWMAAIERCFLEPRSKELQTNSFIGVSWREHAESVLSQLRERYGNR